MRDAQRGEASAVSAVSSAAVPYLVRSAARVAADFREDARLGRRRWVGLVDDEVAGTATARIVADHDGEREVFLTVEVHPDFGSRGVGTALLQTAGSAFPGTSGLQAVCTDDPIAMAFAVRNGFLPEADHPVASLDPRTVPTVGPPPKGMRPVTLAAMPDLRMLMETNNLAARDDPSLQMRRLTMYQLRSEWWDDPDNAPELSWGLLAQVGSAPVLAAFSSVQLDRDRGRAWCALTATHPDFRGRALSAWVRQRVLNALAERRLTDAWTPYEADNPRLLALNDAVGFRPTARSVRVARRLLRF